MPRSARTPLRQWIWRAFVQSALIPLILVESVLITAYLLTNSAIRDAQVDYLQQSALEDLSSAVLREGKVIDMRLQGIEVPTRLFRDAVGRSLHDRNFRPDDLERQRHVLSSDGVFYTRSDDGRAASFYASSTPVEKQDHEKALRLSQVDPLMRSIREANPAVPSNVDQVVLKALARDPEQRYQTAAELRDALMALRQDLPVFPAPEGRRDHAGRPDRPGIPPIDSALPWPTWETSRRALLAGTVRAAEWTARTSRRARELAGTVLPDAMTRAQLLTPGSLALSV